MPAHTLPVSRRLMLTGSAALAAGAGLGIVSSGEPDPARPRKVIDAHAHLYHHSRPTWVGDDQKLIEAGDRLGIDQFCCSILTPRRPATAEGFRDCNRWVADAMKRFPGRVFGYCYVNPGHTREALDEVRRCVEGRGFIGVKLYNLLFACDMSMTASVGRMRGADLTPVERRKILGENMERLLARRRS